MRDLTNFGLNVDVVRELIAQSGLTPAEIDERCVFGQRFTADVINGHNRHEMVAVWKAQALALELGVDISVILKKPEKTCPILTKKPRLHRGTKIFECATPSIDIFGEGQLKRTKRWLTYTRCAHVYYMPPDMKDWFIELSYKRLGWTPDMIEKHKLQNQPKRRWETEKQSGFPYRREHLMRAQVFQDGHLLNSDWASAVTDNLQATGGQVRLALPDEDAWRAFDLRLAKLGFPNCCCIDVIDEVVASVTPICGGMQFVIDDSDIVGGLARTITRCIKEWGGSKPLAVKEAVIKGPLPR